MDIESHRRHSRPELDDDDDERSEGELNSSCSDGETDEQVLCQPTVRPKLISQSWTNMLTEHNLSSIMSNALADNSEIIHIDDPIAQQSANPLTYVFPPGTDANEYFQRKQKQAEAKPSRKPNRRDLKNLSHLLNRERNEDLLRAILDVIGCRRAFQFAHEAIRLHKANDASITKAEDGQVRTLGGVYFKMFLNDADGNSLLNEKEREEIKKRNQAIQKAMKKKQKNKKRKKQKED